MKVAATELGANEVGALTVGGAILDLVADRSTDLVQQRAHLSPETAYNRGMRRALQWTFTIASILLSCLALVMALLEVVHLAHSQPTEHAAGIFAMQALVLAAVFAVSALAAARPGETAKTA